MKKFMLGFLIPVACYMAGYMIMDMSIGKELVVGGLFMIGFMVSEHGKKD